MIETIFKYPYSTGLPCRLSLITYCAVKIFQKQLQLYKGGVKTEGALIADEGGENNGAGTSKMRERALT